MITLGGRLREAAKSAGLPDLPADKSDKGRDAFTSALDKVNRKRAKAHKKLAE